MLMLIFRHDAAVFRYSFRYAIAVFRYVFHADVAMLFRRCCAMLPRLMFRYCHYFLLSYACFIAAAADYAAAAGHR